MAIAAAAPTVAGAIIAGNGGDIRKTEQGDPARKCCINARRCGVLWDTERSIFAGDYAGSRYSATEPALRSAKLVTRGVEGVVCPTHVENTACRRLKGCPHAVDAWFPITPEVTGF
jgi:hypothetical protein